MESVYNDEKIVDEQTAQKLMTAYTAAISALNNNVSPAINLAPNLSTNELLTQILFEIREIRKELQFRKRVRLEF
jgi:hypothetical protein